MVDPVLYRLEEIQRSITHGRLAEVGPRWQALSDSSAGAAHASMELRRFPFDLVP